MSIPQHHCSGYTIEDWKLWEGRWELINGVAYDMTPAPNVEHQRISGRLFVAIFAALEEGRRKSGGGECELFYAPIDLFLPNEESVYQPDLVVVCDPTKIAPHGIVGVPDLIIEILSPTTTSRDWTRKRWSYEAAGVPEYLILDPDERVAVLHRLEEGRYKDIVRAEWKAMLPLLGGRLFITLGEPEPN